MPNITIKHIHRKRFDYEYYLLDFKEVIKKYVELSNKLFFILSKHNYDKILSYFLY